MMIQIVKLPIISSSFPTKSVLLVKYIGIQGLLKIYDTDCSLVLRYRELVLPCIDDIDVTLRKKVLELFSRMVLIESDECKECLIFTIGEQR
jgi:hypothetical protein